MIGTAALVSTLWEAGPDLLRGIGSLFGGKTNEVVSKAANVVDDIQRRGGSQADAEKAIGSAMSAGDMLELERIHGDIKTKMAEIAERREANKLNAETARHTSSQETIQTEMIHGTAYAKNTRPKMARLSGYAMVYYVLVSETAKLIASAWGMELSGADLAIAGILFSPCGTYMTMRTFDSFSNKGRS